MSKYRKKPVVIDAVQFDPHKHPWPEGVEPWAEDEPRPKDMSWGYIQTPEGSVHVLAGDWIITGAYGVKYTCKPDIFSKAYDPVDEEKEVDDYQKLKNMITVANPSAGNGAIRLDHILRTIIKARYSELDNGFHHALIDIKNSGWDVDYDNLEEQRVEVGQFLINLLVQK